MAISKQKKEELVAEYAELLEQSQAIFLTEYTGLDVRQLQQLRSEVRKAEGTYRVTKNTLLLLALEKSGKPIPVELLTGQLATGFALQEVPALAKTLTEFAKDQEQFAIKGGILGDKLLTAEQVEELAKLPTLDELRARIIGLIQAPLRNVVFTVSSSVQQVVNVLDAYARQEGESETEAEATLS